VAKKGDRYLDREWWSSAGIGRISVQSNEMNRRLSDDGESYTRDRTRSQILLLLLFSSSLCVCVSVDYQESRAPFFFSFSLSLPIHLENKDDEGVIV
jgi:hypothetical protein